MRNTGYAKQMADSMGSLASPPDIEDNANARKQLGAACLTHIRREFNTPGLQLGVRYISAVISHEDAAPPPDDPNRYVPSGFPGARAPHVPLAGRASLHDRFGREFTLLVLREAGAADAWRAAAQALSMPLDVLHHTDTEARALYGADCVLIRPDLHIAWRGDAAANPDAVLRRALGRAR